jgi:hypothetical protein
MVEIAVETLVQIVGIAIVGGFFVGVLFERKMDKKFGNKEIELEIARQKGIGEGIQIVRKELNL